MDDFRSNSCYADNRSSQLDIYQYGPPPPAMGGMQASSVYPSQNTNQLEMRKDDPKLKKGKSMSGSVSKAWSFNDPELQRKKRVASYKAYTVEGKVKGSFKKSFRWLKDRYSRVVYGWW
ncbi:hypothetical protein LINPERPRIM_LOCUS38779 [Linum perenne]